MTMNATLYHSGNRSLRGRKACGPRPVARGFGLAMLLLLGLVVPVRADHLVTLAPGRAVTLSVTAEGTAPFTYEWRRDGVPLAGATSDRYAIASVGAADAGVYTVKVANSAGSTLSDAATLVIEAAVAPVMVASPLSQSVYSGATVVFSATVTGSEPMTYRWERAGVPVTDNGRIFGSSTSSLTLTSVSAADAGSYRLVAGNAAGSVTSSSATLAVLDPNVAPSITTQPVAQSVTEGATVSFTASASGNPAPTYQWRKNGVAVADGGNVSGATSATLALTNVTAADAATYTVAASNVAGTAISSGVSLVVSAPLSAPKVISAPVSQTVTEGMTVTFTAEISANPTPTYRWKKSGVSVFDGGNVSGATTNKLTIRNVTLEQAGSYGLYAVNNVGRVMSSYATLTVNALAIAPAITTQPVSQSVLEGATVTLTSAASGSPAPSYQWYKDGVPLLNGGNITGATTGSLVIGVAALADAGRYHLVATNSAGAATSSAATVGVTKPAVAPAITMQPVAQTATEGTTVRFTAGASGYPAPTYRWRKNGVALVDGGNVSGATSATLTIANVSASDAAVYSFVASNVAGSAASADAGLAVTPPLSAPKFIQVPVAQTVTEGMTVTLTAQATGYPAPSYRWMKGGVSVQDGGNISGATTTTLTITNVTLEQAGSYGLHAVNSLGNVTSAYATLTVNARAVAPAITTQPVSQSVLEGVTVTLTAAASGNPAPAYQWYKDGVPLLNAGNVTGATTGSLVITAATSANTGLYRVVATNTAGSASSSDAAVTVSAPPVVEPEPEPVRTVPTLDQLLTYNNKVPAAFSYAGYIARYPKYKTRFKSNALAGWRYYRDTGVYAGEVYDELFRPEEYLALHPELLAAYGPDLRAALLHWVNIGYAEGWEGRF